MDQMRKDELFLALRHATKKLEQTNETRELAFKRIAEINNLLAELQESIDICDNKMLKWDELSDNLRLELENRFSTSIPVNVNMQELYELHKATV